ncbi:hypothetical protein ZEAMMB73_Zm00001d013721 [Zea mays]|uniref:Uncharacterized protein n=1 Tax=Zea mays TaxID=4577 RepID=A0A1D6GLP7_MAIZE|nr:hypothetical protein ZEAMMB73_Zm00001d013721 [Zea mays]
MRRSDGMIHILMHLMRTFVLKCKDWILWRLHPLETHRACVLFHAFCRVLSASCVGKRTVYLL